MTIELNHTIIQAKDAEVSAKFLAEMLGLPYFIWTIHCSQNQ